MLAADSPVKIDKILGELKKGKCTGFCQALDANANFRDIKPIFEGIISATNIPVSASREAFRALASKVEISILAESLKGNKLRNECIDFIPIALSVISEKEKIEFKSGQKYSGRALAVSLIQSVASSSLHPESILPLIVALRDVNFPLPLNIYESLVKRTEDVPLKDVPAVIYQSLLWCNGSPSLLSCFETILALIESQREQVNVGECLAHIKLALNHESTISTTFFKYAKSSLQNSLNLSPILIILFLGSPTGLESQKHVLNFLVNLAQTRKRLEQMGCTPGIELSQWPKLERVLERWIDIVDVDDEPSILALINLGKELSFYKNPDDCIVQLSQDSAVFLLKFKVSRRMLIKSIIDDIALYGGSCIPSPFLKPLAKVLNELATMDDGRLFCEILREMSDSVISFVKGLEKINASQNLILSIFTDEQLFSVAEIRSLIEQFSSGRSSSAFQFRMLLHVVDLLPLKATVYKVFLEAINSIPNSCLTIFTLAFLQLWIDGNVTNWSGMVRRSIDEHGRVTEFMPILFKIMVCCRKRLENPGEESALFAGAMNNLTESLCQDIEWFSSDLPTASQNSLRPIITGLYDIALIFCLDSDDLDARTKISAAEKIIACRDHFTAQFSTPTPDLVIVSIDNGLQLLQLYLDGKTQRRLLSGWIGKLHLVSKHGTLSITEISELAKLLSLLAGRDASTRDLCNLAEIINDACMKTDGFSDTGINSSLVQICKTWSPSSDSDATFAKILTQIANNFPRDLAGNNFRTICKDILAITGRHDDDPEEAEKRVALQTNLKFITSRSVNVVISTVLTGLKDRIEDCKWLVDLTIQVCKLSNTQGVLSLSFICDNLNWISEACSIMTQTALVGVNYSKLLDVLQFLFKTAVVVCRLMMSRKLPLSDSFTKMVATISGDFTRNIYVMLPIIQQNELELFRELSVQKKKTGLTRRFNSSIAKETRLIPGLIYHIEAFERNILALSNLHRTTIVKSFHRSTARDFRIQLEELENALEPAVESGAEETTETFNEPTDMSLGISTEIEG